MNPLLQSPRRHRIGPAGVTGRNGENEMEKVFSLPSYVSVAPECCIRTLVVAPSDLVAAQSGSCVRAEDSIFLHVRPFGVPRRFATILL